VIRVSIYKEQSYKLSSIYNKILQIKPKLEATKASADCLQQHCWFSSLTLLYACEFLVKWQLQ